MLAATSGRWETINREPSSWAHSCNTGWTFTVTGRPWKQGHPCNWKTLADSGSPWPSPRPHIYLCLDGNPYMHSWGDCKLKNWHSLQNRFNSLRNTAAKGPDSVTLKSVLTSWENPATQPRLGDRKYTEPCWCRAAGSTWYIEIWLSFPDTEGMDGNAHSRGNKNTMLLARKVASCSSDWSKRTGVWSNTKPLSTVMELWSKVSIAARSHGNIFIGPPPTSVYSKIRSHRSNTPGICVGLLLHRCSPTDEETANAIQCLKNNKAPDEVDLTADKHATDVIVTWLE